MVGLDTPPPPPVVDRTANVPSVDVVPVTILLLVSTLLSLTCDHATARPETDAGRFPSRPLSAAAAL